jgi:hypothetical protein
MPTRHLSDEQRQRYANFTAAPSPDQLARYFHLDRSDREITDGLRGDHNRLGFALMLGSARFIGVFPGADAEIPSSVMAFLVDQLCLKRSPGLNGYFDPNNGQRLRHLALIRERYGFTEFADNGRARFRLTRWLYALCWSGDDHPGPLIERAASWLVVNKVLLPGVSVLERFVGRIRDRAQTRLWKRLVAALDGKQRERIAKLFDERSESGFAALDALRTVPTQRSSGEFLRHLDRLEAIRAFDLRLSPPKGVPAATLARALSEIGRIAKTIHILHYIDDAAFRRRILTQLNHTELRHRLGRRIHHGERGEIRSPLQQGQEEQLGALGLALNAVLHWNAIYMQEAIRQVRLDSMEVRDDDIAHLTPLIWRHLNFLGRYDFSLPDTVMNGGLRPLRNPTSAWDF